MDVCRITPAGGRHLDEDEIGQVRSRVARWVELEQLALDELFG